MRNYSSVSLLTGHELRYKNTRGNSAGIHRTWGFLRREGVAWWYWEKFSADFAPLEVDCWRIHPRWFAKGPFLFYNIFVFFVEYLASQTWWLFVIFSQGVFPQVQTARIFCFRLRKVEHLTVRKLTHLANGELSPENWHFEPKHHLKGKSSEPNFHILCVMLFSRV